MTLVNRDLFVSDPTTRKIPNDGVARVSHPETDQEWDVLRWELSSFVCEGQYEQGMARILDSFLTSLSQSQQPAVWVSGFYGSGKSHLVRVLEYLWLDQPLPDGQSPRDLVRDLPTSIGDSLTELTNAGKRTGGLWSAAGTLAAGANDAVRLAFLAVLFGSAGLPERYQLAKFMIWATDRGYLEQLEAAAESAGKTLAREVNDLYVSPVIAEALLEADPTLGGSIKEVRDLLRDQFPHSTKDITDDEMLDAMEDVLRLQSSDGDKLPLTLVILDEMQQYIGENNEKALAVQNIVEKCSARFESKVLIVATGQSALTQTATLQKLTDRFAVQVALSDKDVESVVRKVILQKKPDQIAGLKETLERERPEIDRQLRGTQLEAKAADAQDWVPDYPLLPTRRRFWELALRGIDKAQKAGVLRTQLKIVHEAACDVAADPVGTVVAGDFIYEQQSPGMLQSGVLLKQIDELIRGLRSEVPDGRLKSRICALVFLIGQIPTTGLGGETGLRATAPFIADLLVEDLSDDGAELRKRVPEMLEALAVEGRLMRIDDDEYRLQTEEGAEWEKDFRTRLAAIRDDANKLGQYRNERLQMAMDDALGGFALRQGASSTPRTWKVHWGEDTPVATDGHVPIWVRDEWSATESAVKRAAAEAGEESPIVFVYLPKFEPEQIKDALAAHSAAKETTEQRAVPQTEEGRIALTAMKTREASESDRLKELFGSVAARARIFQAGGNELTATDTGESVKLAAERALIRLFPRFVDADNANWGKVGTRAREGAPDALSAVGHNDDPAKNAVCKEVLGAISGAGVAGGDIQKQFQGAPYGWPRDAVNGAVLALLAAGNIRAAVDGNPLAGAKELPPTQIGKAIFFKEDDPPSVEQTMAVRALLSEAGIAYENGQEGQQVPALLQKLTDLSEGFSGDPPLPTAPENHRIAELRALVGNQQFRAVADEFDSLSADLKEWQKLESIRGAREAAWNQLLRLQNHARGLPAAGASNDQIEAIRSDRQLLSDPDPVAPISGALEDALREEVMARFRCVSEEREAAVKDLGEDSSWVQLAADDQNQILAAVDLLPMSTPAISDVRELIGSLDQTSLSSWSKLESMIPMSKMSARERAAKKLEPAAVRIELPGATIRTPEELETYLEELRARVAEVLASDKPAIL